MMIAAVLFASIASAHAQQGAEACKTISRGIDRLACFDKAYEVENKLAEPLPVVRVKPSAVRAEPEILPARPVTPSVEWP